jgi:aryl-alcohol dehydrogenase-like predicted oxidoreductase
MHTLNNKIAYDRIKINSHPSKKGSMTEKINQVEFSLNNIIIGVGAWSWGDRFFWNYGGSYSDSDISEAFRSSLEAGINFFDTAEVYGQGRSEQILGRLVKASESPILVATKYFPYPWRISRKSLHNALHGSLKRLQCDHVSLYQIHWPASIIPLDTLMKSLVEEVRAGKTLAVGVSNFNINQTQQAFTALGKNGIPLASNQVEYHLLNRKVEKNGLLARCQELGVRIIAYSPLAQGLLTGKYSPESPPPGVRGRRYASLLKEIKPLIGLMTEIGKGHGGKTPGQVALNWLICKGALPIPGAKNLAQVQQNNRSVGWRLSEDEVASLDNASDGVGR